MMADSAACGSKPHEKGVSLVRYHHRGWKAGGGAAEGRGSCLDDYRPLRRPAADGARVVLVGRRGGPDLLPAQPQKLKNISRNPRVGLNLNSDEQGDDVVRLEGTANIDEDAPLRARSHSYVEKYREGIARIGFDVEGFARSYSVAVRVTPERWQVW